MIPSPFQVWTADTIDVLVSARVPESRGLDYKLVLPTNSTDFAADASAFANTDGGVIVFGVREHQGEPAEIEGVDCPNRDKESLRLATILQTNLDPPLTGFHLDWISTEDSKTVLALRIFPSGGAPHMVLKNARNFYSRGIAGNVPMGSYDLRNAFAAQGQSVVKFRDFVYAQCLAISDKEGPFPLAQPGHAVFHLMPIRATTRPSDVDIPTLRAATADIRPPDYGGGWLTKAFLNGIAVASPLGAEFSSYVQFFRNGSIEAVANCLSYDGKFLSPAYLEAFDKTLPSYVDVIEKIGGNAPWMAAMSLVGCEGKPLWTGFGASSTSRTVDESTFLLPMIEWLDGTESWTSVLRQFADRIANYFGQDKSPYFTKDGQVKLPS